MGFFTNMVAAFDHGGFVMWIIFAGQMISIAIMAERAYALYMVRTLDNRQMVKTLEEDIKKGRLDAVITKTQLLAGSGSAIGKAVLAGTQAARSSGGNEEIQSKMDEVLLGEGSVLEKRIGFLAAIGNIGTLAGLLGTIIGLIDSFSAVANANPVEKAALLSNGISMAMYATAYGLLMAIPALVGYAVLQNRANAIADDLNQSALMACNWLSYNYEPVKEKPTRRAGLSN